MLNLKSLGIDRRVRPVGGERVFFCCCVLCVDLGGVECVGVRVGASYVTVFVIVLGLWGW